VEISNLTFTDYDLDKDYIGGNVQFTSHVVNVNDYSGVRGVGSTTIDTYLNKENTRRVQYNVYLHHNASTSNPFTSHLLNGDLDANRTWIASKSTYLGEVAGEQCAGLFTGLTDCSDTSGGGFNVRDTKTLFNIMIPENTFLVDKLWNDETDPWYSEVLVMPSLTHTANN